MSVTPKIRVLVVEDSATVRRRIVEVLSAEPGFEVVGEAADGKTGIEQCQRLRPDVVTLDMMLPVMSGLAVTEYLMAYCPTPILIVSSSTNRGELFKTYEALAAGALDVLEKPKGTELDGEWERKLIFTVRVVSRVKVITHLRLRLGSPVPRIGARSSAAEAAEVVVIGASTGGPGAVVEILRALPADFPLPILLVIHIGPPFAAAFAQWLDGQSLLRVGHAVDGEPVPARGPGRVILAPPDRHLLISQGKLRLSQAPERHSCRPSIDVLFESVAREKGPRAIGCLLTGMGKDGALGLLELRRAGSRTIAQDEASSVVYGMPREAALLGAAGQVLGLDRIAQALCELADLQ